MDRVIAHVTGRVQGVGFRYFVQARARALGLTGWVKNEPDGTVTFLAEGPKSTLQELIQSAEEGPSSARVAGVDAAWGDAGGEYSGFSIR